MSMNAEPENFDQLCRLLKLKRHESPPPRYFNDFSSQVVARIRAGSAGGRLESPDGVVAGPRWLRQFWRVIEQQPAVSGMLTAAACGLLVVGVFVSDNARPTLNITADGMAKFEAPVTGPAEANRFAAAGPTARGELFANSTNPAIQLRPGPSLFSEFPTLGAPQRVNGMPLAPR
ncbi:MAG: hypothetical protein V9H26_03585 [Verrucomicrobiota bacterium]|nr:hypothetical protein [Verrucomicrobiota bacterium]MCC6819140.1 hypothetical protein [Limisphaerales bacterium]